jgi:predicted RNA-binding protein with PUA-like domain
MAYWLVKTEPGSWSWDDQVKSGVSGGEWTGVRNPQARAHLKAMRKGDRVFFYHTGNEKAVIGIAEVVREAHPDSTDPEGSAVDIKAIEPLKRPVSLAEVKADPLLGDMVLAKAPRLSVQPVTETEWQRILELSKAKG